MNAALERAISEPRLTRYLRDSRGLLDAALSLYERNVRLSEAFYTPLQCLEVTLRNRMNERLTKAFWPTWYWNGRPPFDQATCDRIDKARDDVDRLRPGLSNYQGPVVAELTLGFWVTLLSPSYDSTLWRTTFFNVFHEGGKRMRRDRVHGRMDMLRHLRNRVAHHEPIVHLDLHQHHLDLIQAIAWMCPDSAAWALEHSRVPEVLAQP